MAGKDFSSLMLWNDERMGSYGPGVSRAREGEKTKPFTVVVRQNAGRPMKVTLQARNQTDALKFARNRWPGAAVEVA